MNARYEIETYNANVNADHASGVPTEHSFRGYLQILLKQLLSEGTKKDKNTVSIINEPTRKDYGAPDFEFRRNDVAIAFLETKKIGDTDLLGKNTKQHKEQFDRYKKVWVNNAELEKIFGSSSNITFSTVQVETIYVSLLQFGHRGWHHPLLRLHLQLYPTPFQPT